MSKLGIDIVDLADPKLKERDDRSLKLIQNENDLIISHKNVFWLLWSAKEAIFKARREASNFIPTEIPISIVQQNKSFLFHCQDFHGHFEINENYICAVCAEDLSAIDYEVFHSKEISDSVLTRRSIERFFTDKKIDVSIGSDSLNLPIIIPGNRNISISHHNNWSAFAFPRSLVEASLGDINADEFNDRFK